mmetsp:Transcript_63458/g.200705  ORF Transcript_63458/g.200705 Transcript_63458/m.200705 type:complete len:123 (-) Transcript_63458:355-723(-)
MSFKRRLKNKQPPEGWELIEKVVEDFEAQMREAVNEDQEGKRKHELNWKIHRIHFEKNRFIFDVMYKRKGMSRELVRSCHVASPLSCSPGILNACAFAMPPGVRRRLGEAAAGAATETGGEG